MLVLGSLCVVAQGEGIATANASELVQRNPFDPARKPWKTPPARLPTLTTHDLQIEGIIAFGAFRGILAQLDGKLKGSLPANSAGKVRIAVGQTIGAGYVLERVEANHAIILAGTERMTIPIVRKVNRGGAPSQQAAIPVPAQAAMAMATPAPQAQQAPPPDGAAPTALSAVPPPAAVPPVAEAPPAPPMEAAPAVAAGAPPGQPTQGVPQQQPGQGQPMTLLDAIKAAAEAAKNKSANPPSPSPFPFGGALAPKK